MVWAISDDLGGTLRGVGRVLSARLQGRWRMWMRNWGRAWCSLERA